MRTRGFDRARIRELIEAVDKVYVEDSLAHRVFGSPELRTLGEKLYHSLDGDERWLSQLPPRGAVVRISAEAGLRHLPWELLAKD